LHLDEGHQEGRLSGRRCEDNMEAVRTGKNRPVEKKSCFGRRKKSQKSTAQRNRRKRDIKNFKRK